jgi:dipeptidyl aminopeptidase/acylaminoacyl peptidase/endonuclease/exonuclease/phosphatase family metal-dependent hydrolase
MRHLELSAWSRATRPVRTPLPHAAMALLVSTLVSSLSAQPAARPMTFLDMQRLASSGGYAPSPDGRWLLYTVTTPDWEAARSQSDIHLVSLPQGLPSSRQLTFTSDKNETSPAWSRDGTIFAFLSNRDATGENGGNQLYVMRPDGGEARKITSAAGGVSNFAFSRDGRWIVYRAGRTAQQQLYRLPMSALHTAEPEKLTSHAGGVTDWELAPDSRRVYFLGPDEDAADERLRREQKFTVNIRNAPTPLQSLWALELDPMRATRLTRDSSYTVQGLVISPDSRWIGFTGISSDRYARNITEQGINGDLYLLDVTSGAVERLTNNTEVSEGGLSFSPDSKWLAFSGPDDLTRYTMTNRRVYLRETAARGGAWRKLGEAFDGNVSAEFWSADGRTIYFNEGLKATRQLFALDVARNTVRPLTQLPAALTVTRDDDSGVLLINYSDPATPPTLYTVPSLERVGNRAAWTQLTDVNPQVRTLALGEEREITWTSTDGKPVGGVLNLPVGYQPGQRYPLIVAIHGGPASADLLSFNGGYGSQVYAGAGYVVLKPNYRGSTNYGEAHRTAIVGNYFPLGYDDIITGVDHLIAQGIVDSSRMGMLGWSAGGHWSNWTLVNTDRFKAISSGAGTSNWISMYAQSDVQRNRQFYLGDKLPYEDFDAYWDQSPIKYISKAKTPTMIHVVEGDPRVPSPQSVELHMALKKLGVPTELFMYPGDSHGIPDPRNRLVKSVSEMAWMDYYVRGKGERFTWRDVLGTVKAGATSPAPTIVPDETQPLEVVSYNIRHGRGMDERVDLPRTAAVLRAQSPDIVGLQEVDHRVTRSGGAPQADSLGRLLGMHAAFGAFMPYQGGEYGMGILSRHPIVRSQAIRLPDGNEPRIALLAEVALPGHDTIAVINVHFDWVQNDTLRFAQASALAQVLDTLARPWVLLGDFNDRPGSRTLGLFTRRASEARKPATDHFTFSSTEPVQEIDFIFAAPARAWRVGDARVLTEPMASDHRPVRATLARSTR